MTEKRTRALFLRGGTSKGVFFRGEDLPPTRAEQDALFLRVLGSPDPYGRQLDGLGGGISSLSKAAIVAPSERADADVDYTFAQIAVDRPIVDYSGNCGNLSSAVGPFAVRSGYVEAGDGEAEVRIYNTNTRKIILSRFKVAQGAFDPCGDFVIPGVPGGGSRITLDFLDPGGSGTADLLPSGAPCDMLETEDGTALEASLVDATNPVAFVRAADLGLVGTESPDEIEKVPGLMARLDALRRVAGVKMGMAARPEDVPLGGPKIALVAPAADYTAIDGSRVAADAFDLSVRILSMERVHKAITLTGAMCSATAAQVPDTLPQAASRPVRGDVRIGTPSGVLSVGARLDLTEGPRAVSARVYRTVRFLMDGEVLVED